MQKKLEKTVLGILALTWLSHLVQVFTPETGFDAVWYHLPVVRAVIEHQSLVYLPSLYQSLNPLFSDLIFGVGFSLGGELGAKIIAYLFSLSLVGVTYLLSKKFVNNFWSLVIILVVSTFQVVAWQSASFYVDVAKAMWEISTLWSLMSWKNTQKRSWLALAALFLGASLGTKLFSLFLLPALLVLVYSWSQTKKLLNTFLFLSFSLLIPLPFYIFSFLHTGDPFFAFSQHLLKLGEIGGTTQLWPYIWQRTLQLPAFLSRLFTARDYASISLLLFLPVVVLSLKKIKNNKLLLGLAAFTIWQMMIWWYLPPLSTRYAISGFITWVVISIWAVARLAKAKPQFFKPILLSIALAVLINLVPRAMVNYRSWQYLAGTQTKSQYLQQFFDGNIDQHLKNWHQLN